MSEPVECRRCKGCGKIADTEDGEPWSVWMNLPLQSSAAVMLGTVKPIPCPDCGGTGSKPAPRPGQPAITVLLECHQCGDERVYTLGERVRNGCDVCCCDWFGSAEEAPKVKAVSVVVENNPPLVWPSEGKAA